MVVELRVPVLSALGVRMRLNMHTDVGRCFTTVGICCCPTLSGHMTGSIIMCSRRL